MSGVYDDILEFPEGFDTVVGERGITLSGGQRQRVTIARAQAKNPSILILDDSLSAVDTETENEVLGNIRSILKHRTGIIISHRVSTVMNADRIIYLEDGRIIEEGVPSGAYGPKRSITNYICPSLEKSRMKTWGQRNDRLRSSKRYDQK